MQQRVRVLDDALADQIAAGEVVERPASVVKELLENSLDAGSRHVQVEVAEGGTRLIRVTDDGHGMKPADARLSLKRHATSKIRTANDLERIATLGFRGEALPSIASISRFRLTTRTREDDEGLKLHIEGGKMVEASPAGCAPGTSIEVTDLFFNVPARRKFLRSTATESAHVTDVCQRAALAHPDLRLTLIRDGRKAREFLPVSTWFERAGQVVGDTDLVEISEQRGPIAVRAALSAPEQARSGAQGLHVLVNGRPVRERALARSIAFAYGSVIPPGRFPVGVVHIEVDHREVDVNVHPQKAEVRFCRGREVHDSLTRMLAAQLGTRAWEGVGARKADYWKQRLAPGPTTGRENHGGSPTDSPGQARRGAPQAADMPPTPSFPPDSIRTDTLRDAHSPGGDQRRPPDTMPPGGSASPSGSPGKSGTQAAAGDLSGPEQTTRERDGSLPTARLPDSPNRHLVNAERRKDRPQNSLLPAEPRYRALAQVRNLFIVAEGPDGLYIFDQHATDERVVYHALRKHHAQGDLPMQRLLLPERIELSEIHAALAEEHASEFGKLGVECVRLGPDTVAVHSVPALLRRPDPRKLLSDLIQEFSRESGRHFGDAVDTAIATMACHGSIRAGDRLSLPECQALLTKLELVEDFPGHCPHGRPVLQRLEFGQLERMLGR